MKSSLVFMVTLAFLAISSAKKEGGKGGGKGGPGGPKGPPKCDENFLGKMCVEKNNDDKESKWMSSMTEDCKKIATTAMPKLKSDKAAACAKKADPTTACAALDKAMQDFGQAMGDQCRPKRGPPGGKGGPPGGKGGPKPADK